MAEEINDVYVVGENCATNEDEKRIIKRIASTKGLKREFGPFTALVANDGSVEISTIEGWKIVYPSLTETWAILYGWITDWSDTSQTSIESFIKAIVFPTSIRLIDIDEEYMNAIVSAHVGLNEGNIEPGSVNGEFFESDMYNDDDTDNGDDIDDDDVQ